MKEKCEKQNLKYIVYNLKNMFSEKNITIYEPIEENDKNLYILKEERELNTNEDRNTNEDIKTYIDIIEDENVKETVNDNDINNINEDTNTHQYKNFQNINSNEDININQDINNSQNININQDINTNENININTNQDINTNENNINNENNNNSNENVNNEYRVKRKHSDIIFNLNFFQKIDLKQNENLKKLYDFYSQNFNVIGGEIYKDQRLHPFSDLEKLCKGMDCFAVLQDDEDEENKKTVNIIYYKNELCMTNIESNVNKNINERHKKLFYTIYFIGDLINIISQIEQIENKSEENNLKKAK